MSKQASVRECPRCRPGKEVFWYMGLYEYDVDRATALVQDGRAPVELDDDSVDSSVRESSLDEDHVGHVDAGIPGVIAHVSYRDGQGELHKGHVLIDGHHRAARCLREQRPFHAYLLTEEESQTVLLRGPDSPLPRVKYRPRKANGRYVLKNASTGYAWPLDEQEHFLFTHLDGRRTALELCAAFAKRFGEQLPQELLNAFLLKAQSRGFLRWASPSKLPG